MSDTLRERVARAIDQSLCNARVTENNLFYLPEADAAIALVLEEAAKVVTEHYQELCTEHRLLLVSRAAAIRALKENDDA